MKIKHGKETYWNENKKNEAILDVDREQICVERWKKYAYICEQSVLQGEKKTTQNPLQDSKIVLVTFVKQKDGQ